MTELATLARTVGLTAGLTLVVLGGCGKADKADQADQAGKADKPAAGGPVDLAAVNALVPAALQDKLVFEVREIVEERGSSKTTYTVAAPKGWTQGMKSFAKLEAPSDMGFATRFSVGTNCDGACEPKDWAATVEKVYASFLGGTVIKDDKRPNGRTIIAEAADGTTLVVIAGWTDGAREYSTCGATLDKAVKDAAPAFAKACESVTVRED